MTNDEKILNLLRDKRLIVDFETGNVYAPKPNTPNKSIGSKTKKGYLRTCINYNGKPIYLMIHRIVWVAANGKLPPGKQIDHKNTIKNYNRFTNLEAVSCRENIKRGVAIGVFKNNGENNKNNANRNHLGQFIGKKTAGNLLDGKTWEEWP